jgi:hypothetical protein
MATIPKEKRHAKPKDGNERVEKLFLDGRFDTKPEKTLFNS